MKKNFALILIALGLFTACSKDNNEPRLINKLIYLSESLEYQYHFEYSFIYDANHRLSKMTYVDKLSTKSGYATFTYNNNKVTHNTSDNSQSSTVTVNDQGFITSGRFIDNDPESPSQEDFVVTYNQEGYLSTFEKHIKVETKS